MKRLATGKLLVAVGVLLCGSGAVADTQLSYSELEQRLAALEAQAASQHGVKAASYFGEGEEAGVTVHGACECQPTCECNDGGVYFEYQMLWLRPHVNEGFAGKLSEKHNYSPRFVAGYEDPCGIGARVRYWRYDHGTDILTDGDRIRFGMDVWDLEATNHLRFHGTDVVLGGGLRVADLELTDDDFDRADNNALGLTLAADLRTRLCSDCCNTWSWVYGGRVAVLGGDWEGSTDDNDELRDDNLIVHELWAGLEYKYAYNGCDLYGRLIYELQNWHSDVLAQTGDSDTIGFVGPGVHFGATY